MSLDTLVTMFRPPFAWREYILQSWFVARVSIVPSLALVLPWSVLIIFTLNTLLFDIGAADFSGAAASFAVVTSMAPVSNVMVIAGAGATAICADLGARVIREELDALRVMGVNPIQALVVPRVLAVTTVAFTLAGAVTVVALAITFGFAVFVQHVSPGAFVDHLTLLIGVRNVVVSVFKTTIFGLTGGLIACYMGTTVGGGPAGVGRAVNETVVFSFVAMFAINTTVDAITIPLMLV
ncbi:MlaE family ABC transporter permease [Mycobacterium intracellulare]|uniref:ABC transporter permease n=1 Tax=Mycobacterium intracellulare subsp. chimaera TaxID=222805 RepID=A0ABT7P2J4_MYCIT|nr:ABC transporter permease [Mycobacterium intracellulare]MDM3927508.1 ABC transporter permease [Mycobacterium intracellulare subsp. chimaera]